MSANNRYIIAFLAINAIAMLGFGPYGIVVLQLGPCLGPLFHREAGIMWVLLCGITVVLFALSYCLRANKHLSVAAFCTALLIWYMSAAWFLMLLA